MTEAALAAPDWRSKVNDYYELCKPRVVMLIVFTAVVGMALASPGLIPFNALVFGTLGIGLAACSAAAINQVVDHRIDAKMARTKDRPIVQGHLTIGRSVAFALLLGVISMVMLVVKVNVLTAVLTFISLLGYAVVYTMYLKRATPQNIVIGGAAGAAPPVLGWAAVTNTIDPNALLLFLIIFIWTPPHFWALAIHRKDEYALADIPMLPVTHGVPYTKQQILLYTILLVLITLMPFVTGMSGLIYLIGVIILDAIFVYYAVSLRFFATDKLPMQTFGYSIVYLMVLFALLLVDHYWPHIARLIG